MPRLSDLHDAERELDAALIAKEQLQRKITGIRADIARLKKLGDKTAWYPGPIPVVPAPREDLQKTLDDWLPEDPADRDAYIKTRDRLRAEQLAKTGK